MPSLLIWRDWILVRFWELILEVCILLWLFLISFLEKTVEGDFERGTGSIAFRARFANPDRLLRHGVSGKIRMLTEMEDVILVPQRSTFEIQDFTYVYTVDEEGKVSVRSFEPLSRHGAYYVTKDLPDNTLIVYEGVQQVSDGMVITPEIVDAETVRKQLELSDEVENNK